MLRRLFLAAAVAALALPTRAQERFITVASTTSTKQSGFGGPRRQVMFNDFVIVGPAADPARVSGRSDTNEALRRIAAARAAFVSKGDRSGTHAAELRLWQPAGGDPVAGRGQ